MSVQQPLNRVGRHKQRSRFCWDGRCGVRCHIARMSQRGGRTVAHWDEKVFTLDQDFSSAAIELSPLWSLSSNTSFRLGWSRCAWTASQSCPKTSTARYADARMCGKNTCSVNTYILRVLRSCRFEDTGGTEGSRSTAGAILRSARAELQRLQRRGLRNLERSEKQQCLLHAATCPVARVTIGFFLGRRSGAADRVGTRS